MYTYYQPNPCMRSVGDCSVRAVSKALDTEWGKAYSLLTTFGYNMCDMPSSDSVIGAVLRMHGFERHSLPNTCPDCFTAEDFAREHPQGTFVLGFGNHVAAVVEGTIYDSWDSSNEIPQYYWEKKT